MSSQHTVTTMEPATSAPLIESTEAFHPLSDQWTLWAHLPHNTSWTLSSYIPISTFSTVEETIAVTESLPPALVENCQEPFAVSTVVTAKPLSAPASESVKLATKTETGFPAFEESETFLANVVSVLAAATGAAV